MHCDRGKYPVNLFTVNKAILIMFNIPCKKLRRRKSEVGS
jgi:hypothetical protein